MPSLTPEPAPELSKCGSRSRPQNYMLIPEPVPKLSICASRSRLQNYMWIPKPAPEPYVDRGTGSGTIQMWVSEPAPELYVDPGAGSGNIFGSRSRLQNMWVLEPAQEPYVDPGTGSGTIHCGFLEPAPEQYGSQSRLRNYEYADPRAGSGTTYVDPGAGSGTICGSPETAKNGQVPPRWFCGGKPCVGTPIKHEGKKSEFGARISAGGAGWLRGRGYS